MATTGELIGLLRQIRGASSSMEKLKLAALAWRTLRGLNPDDRLQVARELGLEGAERIIEDLSHRGGLSPSALLTAIHRAEQADPRDLEALVAGFKDPVQRARALEHAVESADTYFAEELAAAGSEPLAADEDDEEDDEAVDEASAAAPTEPPPPLSSAEQSPAISPPEATPALRPTPRPPAPVPPRPPAPTRTRPRPEPFSISDKVAGAATLLGRLRRLDSGLQRHPQLTAEDCRRTVELFPPGWARRRALVRVLQAGSPAGVDQALALIDAAAGPGDRLWALTALADREGLSRADALRLLEAAGSPALHRRIRARLQMR